jgi:hypothetical protein
MVKASFLIFGDSGDGKTALIGEFAKWVFKESGGKIDPSTKKAVGGKRTRVYSADSGGWQTIQPIVDVGIVEVIPMLTIPSAFSWIDKISKGMVPEEKLVNGKKMISWVPKLEGIGCMAYEGITAFSDSLMQNMADKAAAGINIGGDGAFNFTDGDKVIGSNNRGHYMQAQSGVSRAVAASQWLLPQDMYCIWTAMARRGEDENTAVVLGPQAAGKALTHDLPRWFTYTFRVSAEPQEDGSVKHKLYLEDHKDKMLKGAKGLGNSRVPLDAKIKLPNVIEPASLVKAYQSILAASSSAVEALIEELK